VLYYFGGLYHNKPRRQRVGKGQGAPIDTLDLYWLAEESRV